MYVDRAFAKLDHDGNGYINLEELLELLPRVTASTGKEVPADERLAEVRMIGGLQIIHADSISM